MHHAVQGLEMVILGNYRFGQLRGGGLRGDGGYGSEFLALQLVNWAGGYLTQC